MRGFIVFEVFFLGGGLFKIKNKSTKYYVDPHLFMNYVFALENGM